MHAGEIIWQPSPKQISQSRVIKFAQYLGLEESYKALHQFSIQYPEKFWSQIWDYCKLRGHKGQHILSYNKNDNFYNAQWFNQARLNYTDNILYLSQNSGGRSPSISFTDESGVKTLIEGDNFINKVLDCSLALDSCGVKKGDVVAGWLPNCSYTIIAMLATARLGAIWSSCSPDFGADAVLDRFGQINPKVLFTVESYSYKGNVFDMTEATVEIKRKIKSIKHIVRVPFLSASSQNDDWDMFIQEGKKNKSIKTVEVEFDHPLFIMFSSGTTGKPKCIVHSHGGVLLKHTVEHFFHTELSPTDNIFYFTTCGWMMWNWMLSALLCGTRLILYDGNPFYPTAERLLKLWEDEDVSVAGVSAKLIESLAKEKVKVQKGELKKLRMVCSTGSPLSINSFNYIYNSIKKDLCLASISGGTDILGCFVMGSASLPVHCGEIQCATLGMDTQVYDEQGQRLIGEKGELVCCSPFPSVPVYFWGDDKEKSALHNAYFSHFELVWTHGDYAEQTANGGFIIYGRSDATLNPGGVRIGTAEIYRQVEKLEEVIDSLAVGQKWQDDTRIVLFVILNNDEKLNDTLKTKICNIIRKNTSPRHVPAKIIAVPDLPRTISGKISEASVNCCIHNIPVANREALANPESLDAFYDLSELSS